MKYLNLNVNLSVNLINVNQFLAYLTAPDMQMKKLFLLKFHFNPPACYNYGIAVSKWIWNIKKVVFKHIWILNCFRLYMQLECL